MKNKFNLNNPKLGYLLIGLAFASVVLLVNMGVAKVSYPECLWRNDDLYHCRFGTKSTARL